MPGKCIDFGARRRLFYLQDRLQGENCCISIDHTVQDAVTARDKEYLWSCGAYRTREFLSTACKQK